MKYKELLKKQIRELSQDNQKPFAGLMEDLKYQYKVSGPTAVEMMELLQQLVSGAETDTIDGLKTRLMRLDKLREYLLKSDLKGEEQKVVYKAYTKVQTAIRTRKDEASRKFTTLTNLINESSGGLIDSVEDAMSEFPLFKAAIKVGRFVSKTAKDASDKRKQALKERNSSLRKDSELFYKRELLRGQATSKGKKQPKRFATRQEGFYPNTFSGSPLDNISTQVSSAAQDYGTPRASTRPSLSVVNGSKVSESQETKVLKQISSDVKRIVKYLDWKKLQEKDSRLDALEAAREGAKNTQPGKLKLDKGKKAVGSFSFLNSILSTLGLASLFASLSKYILQPLVRFKAIISPIMKPLMAVGGWIFRLGKVLNAVGWALLALEGISYLPQLFGSGKGSAKEQPKSRYTAELEPEGSSLRATPEEIEEYDAKSLTRAVETGSVDFEKLTPKQKGMVVDERTRLAELDFYDKDNRDGPMFSGEYYPARYENQSQKALERAKQETAPEKKLDKTLEEEQKKDPNAAVGALLPLMKVAGSLKLKDLLHTRGRPLGLLFPIDPSSGVEDTGKTLIDKVSEFFGGMFGSGGGASGGSGGSGTSAPTGSYGGATSAGSYGMGIGSGGGGFGTGGSGGLSGSMVPAPAPGQGSNALSSTAASLRQQRMETARSSGAGRNACVWATNQVFQQAGVPLPWSKSNLSVRTALAGLRKNGWTPVAENERKPGDVWVATNGSKRHIGIVGQDGNVINNSSSNGAYTNSMPPNALRKVWGQGQYYRMPKGWVESGGKPGGDPSIPNATGGLEQDLGANPGTNGVTGALTPPGSSGSSQEAAASNNSGTAGGVPKAEPGQSLIPNEGTSTPSTGTGGLSPEQREIVKQELKFQTANSDAKTARAAQRRLDEMEKEDAGIVQAGPAETPAPLQLSRDDSGKTGVASEGFSGRKSKNYDGLVFGAEEEYNDSMIDAAKKAGISVVRDPDTGEEFINDPSGKFEADWKKSNSFDDFNRLRKDTSRPTASSAIQDISRPTPLAPNIIPTPIPYPVGQQGYGGKSSNDQSEEGTCYVDSRTSSCSQASRS